MNKKRMYKRMNKAIRKVMSYMYSIENVWNTTRNLKLYDVFFDCENIVSKYPLLSQNEDTNDLFYDFCDVQYNIFKEEIEQGFIEDLRAYVGRTSSFYITDLNDKKPVYVLNNLIDKVYGGYMGIDFNDDLTVCPLTWSDYYTENELFNELSGDIHYIIHDFYRDVKKYMESAVNFAKYIDDFKENQIDIFTEYCKNRESDLQYDKEQAEKQAIENKIDFGAWAVCHAL